MKKTIDEVVFYGMLFTAIAAVVSIIRTINLGYERGVALYGAICLLIFILLLFVKKKGINRLL